MRLGERQVTRWQKFQDWLDSDEAYLVALVSMIAIFGFTGSPGLVVWAPAVYGIGMYLLLNQIAKDKRAMKLKYDLTNHR